MPVRHYDWIAHFARRTPDKLAAVDLASERRLVQRLDVGQPHVELESLEVDAMVHDCVEHEAVVRTGRKRKCECHA